MMDQGYLQDVQQLEFLDFTVALGRPGVPAANFYCEKEEALAEMNRLGIKQALTYHVMAKGYQSVYGNERLTKENAGIKELISSWVLVPDEEEMGCTPGQFVTKMKENNVKAVRMFPASQSNPYVATRYAFCKWFYGEFMEALEKDRIPVIMTFNPHRRAEPEWDRLFDLASEYPNLPVVLCDGFQRASWSLVKLMKLKSNIYVQSTSVGVQRQLEYMVNKVGPERFIAGSNYPDMHIGAMVGQVLFANLTYEQKKLIAGDNARRLMGLLNKGGKE